MISKLLELFGPGLLKKLASPGQLASVSRTVLKFLGGYLAAVGFSPQAVELFVSGNEAIVAGAISLAIGSAFSFFAEKKKKEE